MAVISNSLWAGRLSVAWLCTLLILIRFAANRALIPSLGLLTMFFFSLDAYVEKESE